MAVEPRGPAVCSDSNKKEGKGEMTKAPISCGRGTGSANSCYATADESLRGSRCGPRGIRTGLRSKCTLSSRRRNTRCWIRHRVKLS